MQEISLWILVGVMSFSNLYASDICDASERTGSISKRGDVNTKEFICEVWFGSFACEVGELRS